MSAAYFRLFMKWYVLLAAFDLNTESVQLKCTLSIVYLACAISLGFLGLPFSSSYRFLRSMCLCLFTSFCLLHSPQYFLPLRISGG